MRRPLREMLERSMAVFVRSRKGRMMDDEQHTLVLRHSLSEASFQAVDLESMVLAHLLPFLIDHPVDSKIQD